MVTPNESAAAMMDLVAKFTGFMDQQRTWAGGAANGGPLGNGYYPFTMPDGTIVYVPSPSYLRDQSGLTFAYPDQFDSRAGTGPDFDDSAALQAMFNKQLQTGVMPALRPRTTYYPRSRIVIDPSRNSLAGNSSHLAFVNKTFLDPTAQQQLIANSEMDDSGAALWIKGTGETGAPPYFNGAMVHTPGEGLNEFMERGQKIIAPVGSIVRVTVKINYLRAHTVGINTYRDFLVSFRRSNQGGAPANAIGGGGLATVASWTYSANTAGYVDGVIVTRDFTITSADPYIRIQSAADLSIDYITARIVPDNVCLLFETAAITAGGQLRGHNYRNFSDFKLSGRPGQPDAQFVEGMVHNTPHRTDADDGFHTRANFYNMDMSDGVGFGVTFGDRSYLSNFFGCRIVTAKACVLSREGTFDAGENIAFFGGNIGGGDVGVRNPGNMEIHMFGTSIDFSRQWYVGGGGFVLNGCHLETNQRTQAGPLIDVLGGHVEIRNTKLQCNGLTDAILETPFRVAKGGFLDIESETPYNLHGTTGALCSGEGRFRFVGRGGTNRSIDAIAKRDDNHNVFGADGRFEQSTIVIPVFTVPNSSGTTFSIDRYTVGVEQQRTFLADVEQGQRVLTNTRSAIDGSPLAMTAGYSQAEIITPGGDAGSKIQPPQGSGSFTATLAVGSRTLTNVSPAPTSGSVRGRFLSGDGIPIGARVIGWSNALGTVELDTAATVAGTGVTVSTGGQIAVLSQPWNGPTGVGATVNVRLANAATAGVSLSAAQAHSGLQSLRCAKGAGFGALPFVVQIAIPCEPDRAFGCELWFKAPGNQGSGMTGVYFQGHFARVEGASGANPRVAQLRQFITDQPQNIDRAAGQDWTRISFSTNRADLSVDHDTYAPTWATHVIVSINLTATPSGYEIFIDDIHGNSL